MTEEGWTAQETVTVTAYLNGNGIPYPAPDGTKILDDSFMVLFNAFWDDVTFTIPADMPGKWSPKLDTSSQQGKPNPQTFKMGDQMKRPGRSLLVLKRAGGG